MPVDTRPRKALEGPTYLRLLAALAADDAIAAPVALPDTLARWIDWSRAVALSRALDAAPAASPHAHDDLDEDAACRDARDALRAAIVQGDRIDGEADAARIQQHCLRHQRAMQAATGRLRGRLRDALAQRQGEAARLAELDAAMEALLSPREQALLAMVPGLLARHFERLQREAAPATARATWRAAFGRDMRDVLLAELDLRFQPIDGLRAALRPH